MKKETKQFELRFGALNPKIITQLKKQGLDIPSIEERRLVEKEREAITLLYFNDIINETEKRKYFDKLFKHIMKVVEFQANEEQTK